LYIQYYIEDAKEKIKTLKINKEVDESFKNFPKYYINLNRSIDRKENIEQDIAEYDIKNIKRVEAFDGKKFDNTKRGENFVNNNLGSKASELAISMSHIKAIKTAFEDGHEKAIIMEDDIDFCLCPYWGKDFKDIVADIPEDCDILLLAHKGTDDNIKILPNKKENDMRLSGVCYLITLKGMKKIIGKHILGDKYHFDSGLKGVVWDIQIMRNLNIYHTGKSLFLYYSFRFKSERVNELDTYFDKESYEVLNHYYNTIK
jgi:hypothetical protein